jgi:hypothetical protein
MRLTDCTSAGGSPRRSGGRSSFRRTASASSSTARRTSREPAEAGPTNVFNYACTWSRSTLVSARNWRADSSPWPPCHITVSSRVFALAKNRIIGRIPGSPGRSPSLKLVRSAYVFCASISRGFHSHGLARLERGRRRRASRPRPGGIRGASFGQGRYVVASQAGELSSTGNA